MELNEQDIRDILNGLSEIKERLARIETTQGLPAAACSVHAEQIKDLKSDMASVKNQLGKHNLIAATLGAIGAAIVLALKYAVSR